MSSFKRFRLAVAAFAVVAVPAALVFARGEPAEAQTAAVQTPAASTAPAVSVNPATGRPDSFADLAHRLLPSVVNISTLQVMAQPQVEAPQFPPGSPFEDFFKDFMEQQKNMPQQRQRRGASLGSGFIINAEEGYIVTNNHVIADAQSIKVILQDDTNLDAQIVGRDEKTDLAIIKVNPGNHKLVAVPWGDSDAMRVGDWIIAIGNPFGLGGTVTQGIISARARDIQSGPYDDYLQTDASINRGNSGGPMFNLRGEVVGINSSIFSPTGGSVGIGFAIPSNLAKSVINQLVEYGRTKRGWLGVRIQAVTQDIADSLNLGAPRGALIASVSADGPAAKAGIEAGDIVLMFDSKPIEEMRRLPRIVAETPIGKEVPIKVWRRGATKDLRVTVAELEVAEQEGLTGSTAGQEEQKDPPAAEAKAHGLSLSTLSDELRAQYEVPENVNGVAITAVEDDSQAAERGLEAGDVIVEANQNEVKAPSDLVKQFDTAKEAGRKSVFLLVARKDDLRFVALPLDPPPSANPDKPQRGQNQKPE